MTIPIRAPVAVIATVAGVWLLYSFQPPQATAHTPGSAFVSASPQPAASPTPPGDTQSPTAAPTDAPTPTPTPAALYRDGTFTGTDSPNDFGDVQVKVIVSGGRITDVQPIQMPFDRERSALISQQVAPLIHDEVIAAQSANIDVISGATYTTESYAQSVQSALDQAHR